MTNLEQLITVFNEQIVDYTKSMHGTTPTAMDDELVAELANARDKLIVLSQIRHRNVLAKFNAMKALNERRRQLQSLQAIASIPAAPQPAVN
jgi:hypothetical protein